MTNLELMMQAFANGVDVKQTKTTHGTYASEDCFFDDLAEDGSNIDEPALWVNENYDQVKDIGYDVHIDDLSNWDKSILEKAKATSPESFDMDEYEADWQGLTKDELWHVLHALFDDNPNAIKIERSDD